MTFETLGAVTLELLDIVIIFIIAAGMDLLAIATNWMLIRRSEKRSAERFVSKEHYEELLSLMMSIQISNAGVSEKVSILISKIELEVLDRSAVNRAIAERLNTISKILKDPSIELREKKPG